jgi:hypothetical protein
MMPDKTDCWKTITSCSTIREIQEPTTAISLVFHDVYGKQSRLQIKMRRNMSFGQLIALLRAKFSDTEKYQLSIMVPNQDDSREWRFIFDSDTPDSVRSLFHELNWSIY